MNIRIKRAYDEAEAGDGYRVLVDRIWPRGVRKDLAALDDWIKPLAPSTELRKWFAHDPARWDEFQQRYAAELAGNDDAQAALDQLRQRARQGPVTLVYASRETHCNNAVFLQKLLTDDT